MSTHKLNNEATLAMLTGKAKFNAKEFVDAKVDYQVAVAKYTESRNAEALKVAQLNLGAALIETGELPAALQALTAAAGYDGEELNKNLSLYHLKLGITQKVTPTIDKAIASFKEALILNAEDANIYYQLGTALIVQKQFPAALEHFTKALVTASTNELKLSTYCKIIECKLIQGLNPEDAMLAKANTAYDTLTADQKAEPIHQSEFIFIQDNLIAKDLFDKKHDDARAKLEVLEQATVLRIENDLEGLALKKFNAALIHANVASKSDIQKKAMTMLFTLAKALSPVPALATEEFLEQIKGDLDSMSGLADLGEKSDVFSTHALGDIADYNYATIDTLFA